MIITSLNFLLFLAVSVLVFYLLPRRARWFALLAYSILFFCLAGNPGYVLYLILGVLSAYLGTCLLAKKQSARPRTRRTILFFTILPIFALLFIFKYLNIFPLTLNLFSRFFGAGVEFGTFEVLAVLGISYYSLSLIGYILDVYWGAYAPEKNPLKVLLFACFYPTLISGPITRFPHMKKQLFSPHRLDYANIYMGFERILFGFMKKLVIADQLGPIVKAIFDAPQTFTGFYIVLGVVLYALQIYMDFSGCMDIVNGAALTYGIKLPENFASPFFSKNLSEFWRRWHITLGTWAKDYIMYPLLKSAPLQKISQKSRARFGKRLGKLLPTILTILILWLLIGLWHGASFQYIFAAGIIPWLYLTSSQLFERPLQSLTKKLKINTQCFSFRLFQSVRTFLLMCLLWFFVCIPELSVAPTAIKKLTVLGEPEFISQLPPISVIITILMLGVVFAVDFLKYRGVDVLAAFQRQNLLFRWICLLGLAAIIIIFGAYGPGYNATDFIYGGF